MLREVRPVLANAESPIVVTELPIVKFVRVETSLKALSPMCVTESGITREVNWVPLKAD